MIYRDLLARAEKKPNGCIEWKGPKNQKGYGQIYTKRLGKKGRPYLVHRIVWEMFNGRLSDDLMVCHHCDNPKCINIKHLFVGTAKDNFDDAVRKGRITPIGNPSYNPSTRPRSLSLPWSFF